MSAVIDAASPTRYCRARMNYLSRRDPALPVAREVDILDARVAAPGYAAAGFTCLHHDSAVRDWTDADELARVHAKEIAALAREFSGADRVVVYPPIVRSPRTAADQADYAPIEYVHSDFTEDYLPMLRGPERAYRRFIEPVLAAHGLDRSVLDRAERVALLQFWRNTGAAWPDRPFALCDKRCVSRSRLQAALVDSYGGLRLEFESFGVFAPPADAPDRWYTWPGLTDGEVLLFHTYDSALVAAGEAFWVPHSAFHDPCVDADAPCRESVEMRTLCLWGV